MSRRPQYFVVFLVAVFCFFQLAESQVTFSKGWGPGSGKRAVALQENDYQINPKTLAILFHSLMLEMKRMVAHDQQAAINYLQNNV